MRPQVDQMMDTTLELLSRHKTTATFFFVGYLAKRHPQLLRRVSAAGHAIGSHGFWHDDCAAFTLDQLQHDIRDSKVALEDAIGKPVLGYRAPGFSIYSIDHRAIDFVQAAGYQYDSSVLGRESQPYYIRPGLLEVPPNAFSLGPTHWPVNGGCFFRMIPYALYRTYVRRLERKQVPLNFYVHSWELFAGYPRLRLRPDKYFIQYFNLSSVHAKIEKLLQEFTFTSIESQFDFSKSAPAQAPLIIP